MKLKKGEVWAVDSRKGLLTIKLCQAVDTTMDMFFDATIVVGTVRYASIENNFLQNADGQGTPGHVVGFRTTLTHFKQRVKP